MTYQLSKGMTFALIMVLLYATVSFTVPVLSGDYMISSLGGSRDLSHYLICFYAFGNALAIPLTKPLLKRLSPRRSLLLCFLLFGVITTLCGAVSSYWQLVVLRFLQGFVGGPLIPLATIILLAFTPDDRKNRLSKYVLGTSVISPVLGSTFGGVIAYEYHWRLIFLLPLPILIVLSLLLYRHLEDVSIDRPMTGFNLVGYLLFFISIFSITTAITLGQYLDWDRSVLILSLFAIGALTLILYIVWDLQHVSPVIDLSLFKRWKFSLSMIHLAVLFGCYFGLISMLGFWLTFDVTFTPWWIILLLAHMLFAVLVLVCMVGKMNQFDARIWLFAAIILLICSSQFASGFSIQIDFWRLAVSRTMGGFSLALFVYALSRMSAENMNPYEKQQEIVTFHLVRCLGIGLGSAVFSTVVLRRSVFFHERLGSQLTVFSEATSTFFYKAALLGLKGHAANAELSQQLDTQANALALNDTFYMMKYVGISLFITLIFSFMKKTIRTAAPSQ